MPHRFQPIARPMPPIPLGQRIQRRLALSSLPVGELIVVAVFLLVLAVA